MSVKVVPGDDDALDVESERDGAFDGLRGAVAGLACAGGLFGVGDGDLDGPARGVSLDDFHGGRDSVAQARVALVVRARSAGVPMRSPLVGGRPGAQRLVAWSDSGWMSVRTLLRGMGPVAVTLGGGLRMVEQM